MLNYFIIFVYSMIVNNLDRQLLEDERIRKILISNKDLIRKKERDNGNYNLHQFNQYLANKLHVWETYKTGKYLSVNLLIKYLKYCGYSIDYQIQPIEQEQK